MSVFVDTSAFLAISNQQDERHSEAVSAWRRLVDDQELLVTSNYVVVETVALLQSRHGIPAVRRLTQDLLPVVNVEWVDESLHTAAVSAVLASTRKQSPSLVDCVSFEMVRRSKISQIFSFDKHFTQQGFDLVGA